MKTELTPQQIEQYRENGFIVIEDFLTAEELEDWRHNVDESVAERLATKEQALSNAGEDGYYARVFLQCIKLADTHAGMRRLIVDERLGKLAADLAGVDGIRIWHDQALIKPPYGNPTGWHLDNPYWSFSSPNSISLWVALDDATLSNGCMWYVPGTHKAERYENVSIGVNIGDLFEVYPDWKEIAPVSCPAKAGTAVLHNGLVAHGAGANMTNRQRRAMTCAYMPDGSTFNGKRNVLPEAYFNSLKVGDAIQDDEIVPLIYKR